MAERNFTHAEMAKQAGSWVRRAQYELDTIHLVKATIDEAALVFSTEQALESFTLWAINQGYEHIGFVKRDGMNIRTLDHGVASHAFDVRFEFLKLDGFDFRIEAMCVLDGTAPLHEAALAKQGEGAVIHLSWRGAPNGDADGYHRHRRILEAKGGHGALEPLAEYGNSY